MKMRLWYRFCRQVCWTYFNLIHFERAFDRGNVPDDGPVLLVSNHQSFFDPMIAGCGLSREVDYMARASLFDKPNFGKFIRSVNAYPVKRGEADLGAIRETLRRLKEGRAVLLFPEGTRTIDGCISPFKPGLVLLAKKARCPVVPVVIDGSFEAWPRHSSVAKPFVPIRVAFGKPFSPEEVSKLSPDELVTQLNERMIEMQHELRIKTGKTSYDYTKKKKTEVEG